MTDINQILKKVNKIEEFIKEKEADEHTILFHSGISKDDSFLKDGIEPMIGNWLEEILAGAADEDSIDEIKGDSHNEVCFFSKEPNWVSMKASRSAKKNIHEMSLDDIIKHGQLCIVAIENDENNVDFKVAGAKDDDYVERSTYLFSDDVADYNLPFGVERGDIYSHEPVVPDFTLTQLELVVYLARNHPNCNIMNEDVTNVFKDYPTAKIPEQLDLFEEDLKKFIIKKENDVEEKITSIKNNKGRQRP